MDKLFPIVRRVRRPLLPPDDEPGTYVPATALRASTTDDQSSIRDDERPPEPAVPGEAPETAGEAPALPEASE